MAVAPFRGWASIHAAAVLVLGIAGWADSVRARTIHLDLPYTQAAGFGPRRKGFIRCTIPPTNRTALLFMTSDGVRSARTPTVLEAAAEARRSGHEVSVCVAKTDLRHETLYAFELRVAQYMWDAETVIKVDDDVRILNMTRLIALAEESGGECLLWAKVTGARRCGGFGRLPLGWSYLIHMPRLRAAIEHLMPGPSAYAANSSSSGSGRIVRRQDRTL
mmetsp:Transcript_16025/g.54426  ORF Transcript_16025/g.54426 Transcript_16025/m.54426 type:complete len:219 (+) Transcript_16025:1-657(+)